MGLLNFSYYREAQALGHIRGEVPHDTNKDLTEEIIGILRDYESDFTMLFTKFTQSGEGTDQFKAATKKLMGLIKNLKNRPEERPKAARDPLSNTVARPHDGPDGPDGAGAQG